MSQSQLTPLTAIDEIKNLLDFLRRHTDFLLAADFLERRLTMNGAIEAYFNRASHLLRRYVFEFNASPSIEIFIAPEFNIARLRYQPGLFGKVRKEKPKSTLINLKRAIRYLRLVRALQNKPRDSLIIEKPDEILSELARYLPSAALLAQVEIHGAKLAREIQNDLKVNFNPRERAAIRQLMHKYPPGSTIPASASTNEWSPYRGTEPKIHDKVPFYEFWHDPFNRSLHRLINERYGVTGTAVALPEHASQPFIEEIASGDWKKGTEKFFDVVAAAQQFFSSGGVRPVYVRPLDMSQPQDTEAPLAAEAFGYNTEALIRDKIQRAANRGRA